MGPCPLRLALKNEDEFAEQTKTWAAGPFSAELLVFAKDGGRQQLGTSRSCSVMSDSLQAQGLHPARLLCPWDSPGKDTGVGFHFLLQGIFPTQGWNQRLLRLWILYH